MSNELSREEHFEFGRNWQSFLSVLDESRIAEAERGLRRLFPENELSNSNFLDIGCGSGLSALAAARLGATKITAFDIDENSVEATRGLLGRHLQDREWSASVKSVFDISPSSEGLFDIVYSWGVLHHTGDMWRAIGSAAALVKPGGLLAIAIYSKTHFCGFWRWEKARYMRASRLTQLMVRGVYKTLFLSALAVTGRNPRKYVSEYSTHRGMNWTHDVHDWLGGYPYESAEPRAVVDFLEQAGFEVVRSFVGKRHIGLFGSSCDEFVARRRA